MGIPFGQIAGNMWPATFLKSVLRQQSQVSLQNRCARASLIRTPDASAEAKAPHQTKSRVSALAVAPVAELSSDEELPPLHRSATRAAADTARKLCPVLSDADLTERISKFEKFKRARQKLLRKPKSPEQTTPSVSALAEHPGAWNDPNPGRLS